MAAASASFQDMTMPYKFLGDYLMMRIRRHGSKLAQLDAETGEAVSYSVTVTRAEALAKALRARGLGPGRVALLIGENSPHLPWILLGVLRAGGAAYILSPKCTRRELEHTCSISRPHVALVSRAVLEDENVMSCLSAGQGSLRHVLAWGVTGLQPAYDLPQGIAVFRESREPSVGPSVDSDVVILLSSSGTTGLPKAVMFTHDSYIAALRKAIRYFTPDDIVGGIAPYNHTFGLIMLLQALCQGNTMIAFPHFSVPSLLQGIVTHKITALHAVPSLLESLMRHPDKHKLKGLQRILTGGAKISEKLQREIEESLPHAFLFNGYGMTEVVFGPLLCVLTLDKPCALGNEVSFMEYQIRDPGTGKEVPIGTTGEICFRSVTVMKGYLNNPEATKDTIDEDGWLHSGDLGFKDEDGYYFLVDRIKNVFKYNGQQVSPTEIEMVLKTHPGVEEAAVIGVPHKYGEAPLALVIKAQRAAVTERDLKDLVAGQLASHNHLRAGVRFVASLPRTSSGKIQRSQLRELLDQDKKKVHLKSSL